MLLYVYCVAGYSTYVIEDSDRIRIYVTIYIYNRYLFVGLVLILDLAVIYSAVYMDDMHVLYIYTSTIYSQYINISINAYGICTFHV